MISVLCVGPNSVYRSLPGFRCYGAKEDARTFPGDTPVIAHPPCRGWSRFCRHQSHHTVEELELGLWCVEQVQKCGGFLEQPAFSLLFDAAGIREPQSRHSLQLDQYWFGLPIKKKTWLYHEGVQLKPLPYRLYLGDCREAYRKLSKHQRAATPEQFALWMQNCIMSP